MKRQNLTIISCITLSLAFVINPADSIAQKKESPHNDSYFITYPGTVTARFYFSKKYESFLIPASGNAKDIEYRSTTKLNTGIGATYKNFTLNVAFGFGFLNKNSTDKGKTKGSDFQFHLSPYKWAVDGIGIFHKGNYIYPKGYGSGNTSTYYYRPDVKLNLVGISAYRVPNAQKFSLKAALTQNEWQIKSAGSLLFGGEAYYGALQGDSALVPKVVQSGFNQAGIKKINFFRIGPGAGYAYTLVIERNFFVTTSIVGNLDLNLLTEDAGTSKNKKTSVSPSAVYKAAIGYNSSTWNVSANWTGNASWIKGFSSSQDYFFPTGNFRFVISKKIMLKKH